MEYIIVDDSNIEDFDTEGVWALFGKLKNNTTPDEFYCLQVAQTKNIKNEISADMKLLNSSSINNEPIEKEYINQFKEVIFNYKILPSPREYIYYDIQKKFEELTFIIVDDNTKNDDERRKLEKEFAHQTKAIYWRNGGSYGSGDKIDYKHRKKIKKAQKQDGKMIIELD